MIKISVIIPTYGEPLYLDKAIQSVINQTFKEWELIIIDDNNPGTITRDSTEKILQRYSTNNKIKYIKHEKNKNGSVARNTGIKIARGKYISFLDSDDEYLPTRLEECYKVLENNKEFLYGGVYTGCEFRRRGRVYNKFINIKTGNFLIETLACTFMFCTGSNIFMKADIVRQLNGFDESFIRHQDYEFLVRYFEKYSLLAIPEMLVIKNNDNVNVVKTQKIIEIKKKYIEKYRYILKKIGETSQKYVYFNQYIQIAETAFDEGDINTANDYYGIAKKYGKMTFKQVIRRRLLYLKALKVKYFDN